MKPKSVFSPEAAVASSSTASDTKLSSEQAKDEQAYAFGIQAALWGRPLIETR